MRAVGIPRVVGGWREESGPARASGGAAVVSPLSRAGIRTCCPRLWRQPCG